MKRRGKEKTYTLFCRFNRDTKGALFLPSQHAGTFFMLAKRTWTSEVLSASGFPCRSWGLQHEPAQSLGAVSAEQEGASGLQDRAFLGMAVELPSIASSLGWMLLPVRHRTELYRKYLRLCRWHLQSSDFPCSTLCTRSKPPDSPLCCQGLALKLLGRWPALV